MTLALTQSSALHDAVTGWRARSPVDDGVIRLYLLSVLAICALAFLVSDASPGPATIFRVMASSLLLVGAYAGFYAVLRRHAFAALLLIVVLVALPLVPLVRYPLAACGLAGLLLLLCGWRRFETGGLPALPLFAIVIFASSIYTDFQYERDLNAGVLSIDSLFHAAIAAMYKNYGVASIGLDGLVPIGYHTLSHKLMAGLSVFSGLDTLATYAHLFFILGPLLLGFSLAGLALCINRNIGFGAALFCVALTMLMIIVLPVFHQVGLWDSYVASESYLTGLVLLTAALSALFAFREKPQRPALLVAAMALMVFSGMAKASVGVLGFCVLGLFGLVVLRSFKYWLALLVAAVLLYLLVINAAKTGSAFIHLKPFDFVQLYVPAFGMKDMPRKFVLFLVFHYFPVWLCIGTGFFRERKQYLSSNEFLTLFALLMPALVLSLSLDIAGGAVYYFSNVPVVMSFAFLAARADHFARGSRSRIVWIVVASVGAYAIGRAFKWYGGGVKQLFVVMLLLLIVVTNYGIVARRWAFVLCLSAAAYSITEPTILARTVFATVAPAKVDVSAQVAQLRAARESIPVATLVKIENPEMLAGKIGCRAYWAFPALLERPLADGLPKAPWCAELMGGYGLGEYSRTPRVNLKFAQESLQLKP